MDKTTIKNILEKMTLHEKASLLSGIDFWNTKPIARLEIPSITMSDGPHGLRKENNDDVDNVAMKASFPATAFPPAVNMATTWNPSLIHKVGVALGEQCLNQKVDIILGPGTNIKRSPLCGRNFEYFSEDPYLAGRMCVEYINGVQSTGIGTSLKHFAVNSQEYLRMTINEVVDERSFREIYLSAFETAVKEAKPYTVMCSYNKINGVYSSDNRHLLTEILRDEWGFDGAVVSDWNALNNRIEGVKAGMDIEMPSCGGKTDKQVVNAVLNGNLDEKELDIVIERILQLIDKVSHARDEGYFYNYRDGHKLARKVADESIVLLKNEKDLLPLDYTHEIAIIGALAKTSRYQGAGSSRINPFKLESFMDYLDSHNLQYEYADGYNFFNDGYDEKLFNAAIELAKTRDKVVIFAGLTDSYESEGYDRKHLKMPESHNKLIEEIAKVTNNVIVVLFGGSPVEMPWIDKVPTIINAYLPGEAGGAAVADVLFGIVNPSGKLAETYPISLDDYIGSKYYKGGPKNVEHREGLYVGYRYYDSAKKNVLFPFGHGLSYTTFDYSNMQVSSDNIKDTDTLTVTCDITNTGKYYGGEIVQLYIKDVESTVYKPEKELKGFDKVFLNPGETATATMTLNKRSFSYYDVDLKDWFVESGEYEIIIGASSRDIKLSKTITVESTVDYQPRDLRETIPSYYDIQNAVEIPDNEYYSLFEHLPLPNTPSKRGEFDRNTTVGEMRCCLAGKIFLMIAPGIIKGQVPDADMTTMLMIQQGMEEMPMRALGGVTSGLLDDMVMEGLVLWGNKKRLKGLCRIIKGLAKSLMNIKHTKNTENRLKLERKRFKEEEQRIKDEYKAEMEQQNVSLDELMSNLEELKKLRSKSSANDTQYDNISTHIEKQLESIRKQEEEIENKKSEHKEDLEAFNANKREELRLIKEEQKKIKVAMKNYADYIDTEEKLDTDKKSILSAIVSKFKSSDDKDDNTNE